MFAVIYVPQFSLQAVLRHEPDLWARPVALVDPAARQPIVCEMTERARTVGVTTGLSPTQAMARCGEILIRSRSLSQETAASHALLQCAYAFSPHLENTSPGICTLDLRGLLALKGADQASLERWGTQLQTSLARVRLSIKVGIGATPNTARHAAEWGKGVEVVEQAEAFLSGLPVAALEPSSDVSLLLKRWGISTVGELLALGAQALSERLGLEALALMAAASTTSIRPLHVVHPTERFEESFEFPTPVETIEPLLFLLRRFVDQLSARLEPRGFVAETLLLKLALESGEKLVQPLRLPQPTREPDILFRALHTSLETLRTDAAIQQVGLTVLPAAAEEKQLGLFETILADPRQFQETLARLAAVLGPDRVGTPALENSHRPDAFHMAPPDFENAPVPVETPETAASEPMPIRRFRPAVKTEVECELSEPTAPGEQASAPSEKSVAIAAIKSRPLSFRCAVVKGKLKVMIGPWRASGHWWDPTAWEREEWDAATADGRVIRLVHQPDGWYVEGMVD